MSKILAIDFDGVIHKYSAGYKEGEVYDVPMEGALEGLERLVKRGYKVYIHTARVSADLDPAILEQNKLELYYWLDQNGFRENKHYHKVTANKPNALAYIDDRGIRFVNWRDVLAYF